MKPKPAVYEDPAKFADLQKKLLQKERDEEIERTKDLLIASDSHCLSLKKAAELERKGIGIRKLQISEWSISSFGKHLLTLGKKNQLDLPATTITSGKLNIIHDF